MSLKRPGLQGKMFFAIYFTAVCLSLALLLISYRVMSETVTTQYYKHYDTLMKVVGDTLRRTEVAAETLSEDALKYVYEMDKRKGLLSREELAGLAHDLHLSHLYMADKNGIFVRTTDPLSLPRVGVDNLFDFCDGYRGLITGATAIERTPIVPSYPLGAPYKFTMIANHDHTRILEAGVHLSVMGAQLHEAIKSDENVLSLGLYTPTGVSLGSINARGELEHGGDVSAAELSRGGVRFQGGNMILTKRLDASVENCCECRVKGVSGEAGKYYYFLRSEISLGSLGRYIANIKIRLIEVFALSMLVGILLSHWLSRKLISRLNIIREWANRVISTGDLNLKCVVRGNDEVTDLAKSFEHMMASLQANRNAAVEAERTRTLVQLASQVAHDIRSPLTALDVALSITDLSQLPETHRTLLRSAVSRIQDIADNLLKHHRREFQDIPSSGASDEPYSVELIGSLVASIVAETRTQYRARLAVVIELSLPAESYGLFAKVQPGEFKRVLSNIINNAVEAISESGTISIAVRAEKGMIILAVSDTGKGIAAKYLPRVMDRGASFEKHGSSGLGLHHAKTTVENWKGKIGIKSSEGKGTTVSLEIPETEAPSWFVPALEIIPPTTVIIIDDDLSIHHVWEERFAGLPKGSVTLVHLSMPEDLPAWLSADPGGGHRLFLIDYEFLGHSETGLDIISKHGIAPQAMLVTSRFEEERITSECIRLNIGLIPKPMAGLIPVRCIG